MSNRMAFTAVLANKPKDGKHWTLGLAEANVAGYQPVKETGDKADPFFVAKFPTRFDTREEAQAQASELNASMLGLLDETEALRIVASSMGAQNAKAS